MDRIIPGIESWGGELGRELMDVAMRAEVSPEYVCDLWQRIERFEELAQSNFARLAEQWGPETMALLRKKAGADSPDVAELRAIGEEVARLLRVVLAESAALIELSHGRIAMPVLAARIAEQRERAEAELQRIERTLAAAE